MANKSDLIKRVHENCNISKEEAERRINAVLVGILDVLEEEAKKKPTGKKRVRGKLTLVGLGTFEVQSIPARTHRNPQNPSQPVLKPEHNDIKFEAGTALYDGIQEYDDIPL